MTAYARASGIFSFGKLVVEIHSVNRRMLDMSIYLPKDFLCFDIDVRKWIAAKIERGQITVRVYLIANKSNQEKFLSYLTQLKELQSLWNPIAKELGFIPQESINLPFLLEQLQENALLETKEQEFKSALQNSISVALDELMQMKETEGTMLLGDIQNRLDLIRELLDSIERKKGGFYAHYRQKILERLAEIGHIPSELEEKVTKELVFLAERLDVTEELVRLRAHAAQFGQHLSSVVKASGRTLEFILQEILREINTLGSKSMDPDVSTYVVAIKGELEKIREQIQNIE